MGSVDADDRQREADGKRARLILEKGKRSSADIVVSIGMKGRALKNELAAVGELLDIARKLRKIQDDRDDDGKALALNLIREPLEATIEAAERHAAHLALDRSSPHSHLTAAFFQGGVANGFRLGWKDAQIAAALFLLGVDPGRGEDAGFDSLYSRVRTSVSALKKAKKKQRTVRKPRRKK